jgi:hypothetical protein
MIRIISKHGQSNTLLTDQQKISAVVNEFRDYNTSSLNHLPNRRKRNLSEAPPVAGRVTCCFVYQYMQYYDITVISAVEFEISSFAAKLVSDLTVRM